MSPAGEGAARCGFTLVELLVVLLILGLLLVLLPATLVQRLPSVELKASAREVASVLREGRGIAINQNREAAIVIDTESRTFHIAGESRVRNIPQDITITLLTARSEEIDDRSGSIRFYPDGTSTGGGITLRGQDRAYLVVVDWLSGRVTIQEP